MHRILRSVNQRVKGLATRKPHESTTKELLVQLPRVLFRRTSTQQPRQPLKDFGVPNPSWSREMMDQFEKFTKMSEDGSWQHLPSYENCVDIVPDGRRKEDFQNRKPRSFLKSIDEEGMGFELAMFLNRSEKRMVVISQMGPYLAGFPGITHGGAIATLLDHIFGGIAISVNRKVMTANLNVNYKSPVALGSVVLVDSRVDKIEGRKIFVSGEIQSADGQTLHAEATVRSKSGYKPRKHQDACLFVRNVATEGRGFEFAMFYNDSARRMVVVLQPGSYLEGMIGFVHGGAVAAILDHTFASCGICAFGVVLTANLSVNYKSLIPLGSVVLVETKVEKVEEKKIFLSGSVQSPDAQNLYAEATALLIHLDMKTSSHPVTNPN